MLIRSNFEKEYKYTELYTEAVSGRSLYSKVRSKVRDLAIEVCSINRVIDKKYGCIQFPYYHHIFADEVTGFERQLKYLKGFGDFITIDQAIEMLNSNLQIAGRYFCLTFDDGLACCHKYALPILAKLQIPATFYIVTGLVGKLAFPDTNITQDVFGYRGIKTSLKFISWAECRDAINAGVTIGSHTISHTRLSALNPEELDNELVNSKAKIEANTGLPCKHFCAPYGIPGKDFDLIKHGELAKQHGYSSFATGSRGINKPGDSPLALRRDQLLASWSNNQLKYFFSKP